MIQYELTVGAYYILLCHYLSLSELGVPPFILLLFIPSQALPTHS